MLSLGDRMKQYEHDNNITILPYKPFIIRLDGKNFSKFTSGLVKPFDKNFTDAIVATMNNMVLFSNAVTGFCCSDEITLVINRVCTKEEYLSNDDKKLFAHNSNGRKTKLNTIMASKCSVYFNNNICSIFEKLSNDEKSNYTKELLDKVFRRDAIFDSRIIEFPDDKDYEIVNNLIWRSVYDCHRNTVSTYGRYHLGTKTCNNKNSTEMINMMKEKGINWENIPMYFKYGVYAKRIKERSTIVIKGENIEYERSVIKNKCFKIENNDYMLNVILSKIWEDTGVNMIEYQ